MKSNFEFLFDKFSSIINEFNSLAATIRDQRPDLLSNFANTFFEPIPSLPPSGFFKGKKNKTKQSEKVSKNIKIHVRK